MKVIIEEYNPEWSKMFAKEKQVLSAILPNPVRIEHIGSTSIEGLGAKPVIDIMIGLNDFSTVDTLIPHIKSVAYNYVSEFESQMPYRRFFTKDSNGVRTHHIHMVEANTEFWHRHLAFRDYLRAHVVDKDAYYKLKKELFLLEWRDTSEYAQAKTFFIRNIEQKALAKNS